MTFPGYPAMVVIMLSALTHGIMQSPAQYPLPPRGMQEEFAPRGVTTPVNAFAKSPLPLPVRHQTHSMQRSEALRPQMTCGPHQPLACFPPSPPPHPGTPPAQHTHPPQGSSDVYTCRSLTALWFNQCGSRVLSPRH